MNMIMNATTSLDKEITQYLPQLNVKQKKTVLTVVKTFMEEQQDWWDEIGEEQQTQRAFSLFRTDGVRGEERADQEAVSKRHHGQDGEERFAHFRRRLTARGQGANPEGEGKGGQGHEQAEPIRAPSPRRHSKFSFDHRQKTHRAGSLSRTMRGAEAENDLGAPLRNLAAEERGRRATRLRLA